METPIQYFRNTRGKHLYHLTVYMGDSQEIQVALFEANNDQEALKKGCRLTGLSLHDLNAQTDDHGHWECERVEIMKPLPKVKKHKPKAYRELTDEFEVRNALGGNVTGDYEKQLKTLISMGYTVSESIYDDAYLNTTQP
jgi:hypothetical protein